MINQNQTYKIAMVGDCLSGGGAEKVHAQLSVFFAKKGIEVNNCIFLDWITYEHSGSVLNLGKIDPKGFFVIRKWKRFLAFRKFIRQNEFDYIIDFRMRTAILQEVLISKLIYGKGTVYSVRSGILRFYFPKSQMMSRWIYKDKRIHTVSKAICEKIVAGRFADNPHYIYNPVDLKDIDIKKIAFSVSESKYIIAVGRMNDDIKQFGKLITAYSKSGLPDRNIKLLILGEGKNKQQYMALSQSLGLRNFVVFVDFAENPFPYYKNALFSVLSSKNEGFPNVLVEALASGIPAVAFDCFSGPNEIISHKQNGLLVEDQNFHELANAMDMMAGDQNLYNFCKQNARQSVEQFSIENIGGQWLHYLKIT
jgi:glycosyltransferase involved in cell wall biosynthesis